MSQSKARLVTSRNARALRVLARMDVCSNASDALDALFRVLDSATIVEDDEVPRGVVTMGSRVLLRESSDLFREVTLVFPWNDAPREGRVSVVSPLGTALLGARIGVAIRYSPAPEQTARVQLLDVLYQPEAGHQK